MVGIKVENRMEDDMKVYESIKNMVALSAFAIFVLVSCVPANGGYGGYHDGPHSYGETRVPSVVGSRQYEAERVLRKYDLRVGDVEYVNTRRKDLDGQVQYQYPKAGSMVSKGTRVRLGVYQSGDDRPGDLRPPENKPRKVEVPSLEGRSLNEARDILRRYRLLTGRIDYKETANKKLDGKVGSQYPRAGDKVAFGTQVGLSIYKYEKPGPFGRGDDWGRGRHDNGYFDRKSVVPDVVGLSLGEARRTLSGNGFAVGKINEARTAVKSRDGQVFKQDPPPGTKVNRNVNVNLWVNKF